MRPLALVMARRFVTSVKLYGSCGQGTANRIQKYTKTTHKKHKKQIIFCTESLQKRGKKKKKEDVHCPEREESFGSLPMKTREVATLGWR
jgi:hypothetical protein